MSGFLNNGFWRAALIWAGVAGGAFADEGTRTGAPTAQEVLVTLLRDAPDLTAVKSLRGEAPSDTAVLFLAELLHELGIASAVVEDTYSFSVRCDVAVATQDHWACSVILGIKWSGAESALIGDFTLEPDMENATCAITRFDTSDEFHPCGWRVRDDLIDVYILG